MPYPLNRDIPETDVRRWAMLCHLGGLASLTMFPLANVALPVIFWLAKRQDHPYIEVQGREAINFQISMLLYGVTLGLAVYILKVILIGYLFFWVPALIFILQVAGSIIGAIRAYDGEDFRYPLILRFL